jgi:hypothetical protein
VSAAGPDTIVIAQANEWTALPVGMAFSVTGGGTWFPGAAPQGVITYAGPLAQWLFNVRLSATNTLANTTIAKLNLSRNGGNIGAVVADLARQATQVIDNTGPHQMFTQEILTVNNGDTIQPIFTTANGDDVSLEDVLMTASFIGFND